MDGLHHHDTGTRTDTVNLKPREAHLASLCVAVLFGFIGGALALLTAKFTTLPTWALYGAGAILGFIAPWVVCKYYFVTAHHWYGSKSIAHRIYDSVGMIAAIALVYVFSTQT